MSMRAKESLTGDHLSEWYEESEESIQLSGLDLYLFEHPELAKNSVLQVPHVGMLLGGMKSILFVVRPEVATADTPPDLEAHPPVKPSANGVHGLNAFSDFFTRTEQQAEDQFPLALLETQTMIETAKEEARDIKILFIPDFTNESAVDYFVRLNRLSEKTGKLCVVEVELDHAGNDSFWHFPRRIYGRPSTGLSGTD
jgi:hypothetical protein